MTTEEIISAPTNLWQKATIVIVWFMAGFMTLCGLMGFLANRERIKSEVSAVEQRNDSDERQRKEILKAAKINHEDLTKHHEDIMGRLDTIMNRIEKIETIVKK